MTITLNASGVFFIEPNKKTRAELQMRHSKYDLSVNGRVAVMTHPGDVVVMAGGSMRSHDDTSS